jgi:hypothetical protein
MLADISVSPETKFYYSYFLCIHVDIHPQDMFREHDYTENYHFYNGKLLSIDFQTFLWYMLQDMLHWNVNLKNIEVFQVIYF